MTGRGLTLTTDMVAPIMAVFVLLELRGVVFRRRHDYTAKGRTSQDGEFGG